MIVERAAMAVSDDEDDDDENDIFRLMPASLGFLRDQDLAAFGGGAAAEEIGEPAHQIPGDPAVDETRPIKHSVDLVLEKRRVTANIPPPRSKTGLMDVAEFWAYDESNEAEEGISRLARIRPKNNDKTTKNDKPPTILADVAEFWDREERQEAKQTKPGFVSRFSRARSNKGSRQMKHTLDLSFLESQVSQTVSVCDDGKEAGERLLGKSSAALENEAIGSASIPVYDAGLDSVDVVVDAVVDAVDAANRCDSPMFDIEEFESPLIPKVDFGTLRDQSRDRFLDIRSRLADLPEFNEEDAAGTCAPIESLASETEELHETSVNLPWETKEDQAAAPCESLPSETMNIPSEDIPSESRRLQSAARIPSQAKQDQGAVPCESLPSETNDLLDAGPSSESLQTNELQGESPALERIEPQPAAAPCENLQDHHDSASVLGDNSESLASETLEGSVCDEQPDHPTETTPRPGKSRKRAKRKREVKAETAKSPWVEEAGTEWKNGRRCSTRYRSRPLEYWRGEKLLYGRVHKTMPTLIGIKHSSPLPPHPKRGDKPKEFKVESFVPDQFKHLVKLAAI